MGKKPIKKTLGRGDGPAVREQQHAVAAAIAAQQAKDAQDVGGAIARMVHTYATRRPNEL